MFRHIVNPGSRGCSECNLPTCGSLCSQAEKHEKYECSIFARHKHNFTFRFSKNILQKLGTNDFHFRDDRDEFDVSRVPYNAIMMLRILMLKKKDPERWRMFNVLQCSLEDWRKMDPWEKNQEEIIETIQTKLNQDFDREEILKVIFKALQRKVLNAHNFKT